MLTFAQVAPHLIPTAEALLKDNMRNSGNDELYNWYLPVINTRTSRTWENMSSSFASTRMWPERHEGDPLHFTKFGDVDTRVFAMEEFQDGFSVTREYLEFGDPQQAADVIFPRLAEWTTEFASGGLKRHSYNAAKVFLDAFNGTLHTGMDGFPLAHNAHPLPNGGTFDNKSGLPFSAAALTTAYEAAYELTDAHGVPLALNYDTLIYAPALRNTVAEVLDNQVKPGASNDELNVWKGRITRRIECPWFNETEQTGASHYWFLQDSRRHTLKGYIGHMPTFLPEPKIDPMEMIIVAWTVFVFGWHSWQGMYCSDGGS